jgi:hypothetical protein
MARRLGMKTLAPEREVALPSFMAREYSQGER